VVVLPNNGNIRMAAEAAASACENCRAGVVPTKSVLQAFSAMFVADVEGSLEENLEVMTGAIEDVRDGEVTTAVRDSQAADGTPIHDGDVMGIEGGEIVVVGDDVARVTMELIARMQDEEEGDTCTILAGCDLDDETFDVLCAQIEESHPDLEVDAHRGEQPLYPVVFAIE
jgi:dihydroxyacetone kinase-like predicted kinase